MGKGSQGLQTPGSSSVGEGALHSKIPVCFQGTGWVLAKLVSLLLVREWVVVPPPPFDCVNNLG